MKEVRAKSKFKNRYRRKFLQNGSDVLTTSVDGTAYIAPKKNKEVRYAEATLGLSTGRDKVWLEFSGEKGVNQINSLIVDLTRLRKDLIDANEWVKKGGKA